MQVVRDQLHAQAGMVADGSLRRHFPGGKLEGGVVQFDCLLGAVVGGVDRTIDRRVTRGGIRAAGGEGFDDKVRVSLQVVDRAFPSGLGFSAKRSRQGCARNLLAAGSTLEILERDAIERCLDDGLLRCVEMLHASRGDNFSAERIYSEIVDFQIAVSETELPLQVFDVDPFSGSDGGQSVADDLSVDGDVAQNWLISRGLVMQRSIQSDIPHGLDRWRERREILRMNADLIGTVCDGIGVAGDLAVQRDVG